MIDSPPMIQQEVTKEEMLTAYARYQYGQENRFFHSPRQLDSYAACARKHGCVIMAAHFDLLAERCELFDQEQEQQAQAEDERSRRELMGDYR